MEPTRSPVAAAEATDESAQLMKLANRHKDRRSFMREAFAGFWPEENFSKGDDAGF
jgi:hypothetical protein